MHDESYFHLNVLISKHICRVFITYRPILTEILVGLQVVGLITHGRKKKAQILTKCHTGGRHWTA